VARNIVWDFFQFYSIFADEPGNSTDLKGLLISIDFSLLRPMRPNTGVFGRIFLRLSNPNNFQGQDLDAAWDRRLTRHGQK
jgi:hypothetical protein